MKRLLIVGACASLAFAQPALAQIAQPPLGITSPLGLGPAAAVAPVGIPLGATQLMTPGLSPVVSGSACVASSITSGIQNPTALFDAGVSGTPTPCPAIAGAPGNPAASASSPGSMGIRAMAGRTGIPLGSTELAVGGLSPPPDSILLPSAAAAPITSPTAPTIMTPVPISPLPQADSTIAPAGTPCPSGALPSSGSC